MLLSDWIGDKSSPEEVSPGGKTGEDTSNEQARSAGLDVWFASVPNATMPGRDAVASAFFIQAVVPTGGSSPRHPLPPPKSQLAFKEGLSEGQEAASVEICKVSSEDTRSSVKGAARGGLVSCRSCSGGSPGKPKDRINTQEAEPLRGGLL